MWIIALIVLASVLVGLAAWAMLRRLASRGGTSDSSAEHIAAQTLAWSDAYRGTSSHEHPAMDGSIELAPPTQEGGGA